MCHIQTIQIEFWVILTPSPSFFPRGLYTPPNENPDVIFLEIKKIICSQTIFNKVFTVHMYIVQCTAKQTSLQTISHFSWFSAVIQTPVLWPSYIRRHSYFAYEWALGMFFVTWTVDKIQIMYTLYSKQKIYFFSFRSPKSLVGSRLVVPPTKLKAKEQPPNIKVARG